MPGDPLQPVLGGNVPFDATADEVESRTEFDVRLAEGKLGGLVILGLRLDEQPPDLTDVDVRGTLFVGCQLAAPEIEVDLIRRGAHVIPRFDARPYPTHPATLYTPEMLADGFTEGGFADMYDTRVYRHFVEHGSATPDVREALAQRLHDAGIDNALGKVLAAWSGSAGNARRAVGIMGGHAAPRGSAAYRMAATLAWRLAAAGRLVVTGGGPGVMEAANLGAYFSARPAAQLAAAIDQLSAAPHFTAHDPQPPRTAHDAQPPRAAHDPQPHRTAGDPRRHFHALEPQPHLSPLDPRTKNPLSAPDSYTAAAIGVRAAYPAPPQAEADVVGRLRHGGLALPTWLYGHEPANLFAGQIGKYFSNAVREDSILRLSRGGIVFAPGWAGTVQEVFQAATKTFYRTDGPSGAFVFLGTEHWRQLPVESLLRPLLAMSPHGDQSHLIVVTDSLDEAVAALS